MFPILYKKRLNSFVLHLEESPGEERLTNKVKECIGKILELA
jgi:hypothetical protein